MQAVTLMMLLACSPGQADDTASGKWRQYYAATAASYEVYLADPSQRERLPVAEKPVLEWISLNDFNGALFVWTRNGRPELVGDIFSYPLRNRPGFRQVNHIFASLATRPVRMTGPQNRSWRPKPIARLAVVQDAAPPPESARLRRLACRKLAREFSASMVRYDQRWELRMLPKPLLEYDGGPEATRGGALFAFVGYVTDPEILLLIEARKTTDGPRWHYRPVRLSDKSLFLSRGQQTVWESLRTGHGTDGPDTPDPQYRQLVSELVAVDSLQTSPKSVK